MIILALTSMLLACVTSQQSSTGNRHVIKKTVLVNDTIEYSIDHIFRDRHDDVRYSSILPESQQVVKIMSALQQVRFNDSLMLNDCKQATRLTFDLIAALCNDESEIRVIQVSTKYRNISLAWTVKLPPTIGRLLHAWHIDINHSRAVVLYQEHFGSPGYSIQSIGFNGSTPAVSIFDVHAQVSVLKKNVRMFVVYDRLYITGFEGFTVAFNGAYSFVKNSTDNTYTPEAVWYDREPFEETIWIQRPIIGIKCMNILNHFIFGKSLDRAAVIISQSFKDTAQIYSAVNIYMVSCVFESNRTSLNCSSRPFIVDRVVTLEVADSVMIDYRIMTTSSIEGLHDEFAVVIATDTKVGLFVVSDTGEISVKGKLPESPKLLLFKYMIAAEMINDRSMAILFMKKSEASNLVIYNLEEGTVFIRKELLYTESAVMLLNKKVHAVDLIILVRDLISRRSLYPPGLNDTEIYTYNSDTLITNFQSVACNETWYSKVLTSTILTGKDSYVTFVFTVLQDKSLINPETANLFTDIEMYRQSDVNRLYLPLEMHELPVTNLSIQVDFEQSNHMTMTLEEIHLIKVRSLGLQYHDNTDWPERLAFKKNSKIYTSREYLLFVREDYSIEFAKCVPSIVSKNVTCVRNAINYSLAVNDTILDFQVYLNNRQTAWVLLVVGGLNQTCLVVLDIQQFFKEGDIYTNRLCTRIILKKASAYLNGTTVAVIGIKRISSYDVIYGSFFDQDDLYKLSSLPESYNFQSPLAYYDVISLKRLSTGTFMIAGKANHGYVIYTMQISNSEKGLMQVEEWRPANDGYFLISIHLKTILMLDETNGSLYLSSKETEAGAEHYLLIPTHMVIKRVDIVFYVTGGRVGYLMLNNTLLILDIGSLDIHPHRRLIKSINMGEKLGKFLRNMTKDVANIPWSLSELNLDLLSIFALTSVEKGSSMLLIVFYNKDKKFISSFGYILDLYGPNYLATISADHRSPIRNPVEMTLRDISKSSSIKSNYNVMLRMYSTLISAAVLNIRHVVKQPTSFNINDILVSNSHISSFEVDSNFAEVRQSIVQSNDSKSHMQGLYDKQFEVGDRILMYHQYRILVTLSSVKIISLEDPSLKIEFKIAFSFLRVLVEQVGKNPDDFMMLFLIEGEMEMIHFKVYFFSEINYKMQYTSTYLMQACKCRDLRISFLSTNTENYFYGLQYTQNDEQGNSLLTSILNIKLAFVPRPPFRPNPIITIQNDVHKHYVPQRLLDFNMITSESLLLQYYFVENSGYVGIVILSFGANSSLVNAMSASQKLDGKFVLPRNTLISCNRYRQQLAMSCIFFNEAHSHSVRQFSIQFRLDDDSLAVMRSNYNLRLPSGYRPLKLWIGADTDVVIAENIRTEVKVLLFFDQDSKQVIRMMEKNDLPHGYLDNDKPYILEIEHDTWILPSLGVNMSGSVYTRVDPLLIVKPNSQVLMDCNYYMDYLIVNGINTDSEKFSLDSIVDLQCGYNLWLYAGIFFVIIIVMVCLLLTLQCSGNDFDLDYFPRRRRKKPDLSITDDESKIDKTDQTTE